MTALILPSDIRLPLRRKWTLVRTGAVQRTIEDHRLFRKICIYTSRHIIINTDGEEETGKSRMGRSRWDTDICYNLQRTLNRNCYHAVSNQFRKQFMWTDIKHCWLIWHIEVRGKTDYCCVDDGVTNRAVSEPFCTICYHVATKRAVVTKRTDSASHLTRFATLVTKRAWMTKCSAKGLSWSKNKPWLLTTRTCGRRAVFMDSGKSGYGPIRL